MADKKISALTEATSAVGTEVMPLVQSSETKKISVDNLFIGRKFASSTPLATVGTDNVVTANSAFDAATGWTAGAGWAISGGKATHTAGNTATLVGTTSMENARVYKGVIILSGVSAGSVNIDFGGYDLALVLNATGTHSFWGINGGDADLTITPTTDFDGAIEDIKIYEITRSTPELYLELDASGAGYEQPVEFRTGNGHDNLGIGFQALSCVQPDYEFVGDKDSEGPAGPYRGNSNVGIGDRVLASVTTGKYNNAVGQETMLCLTTGYNNTGMGDSVMNNITNGYNNSGFGYEVLGRITKGYENTVMGSNAAYALTSAYRNTLIGSGAGQSLTTGNSNTALGYAALNKAVSVNGNTAIGYGALFENLGAANIAIGYYSLYELTTGTSMTAIGYSSGRKTAENVPLTDTTGIFLGYNTGRTVVSATQLTNYVCIGYNAEVSASNQTVIGNSSMAEVYLGSVSGAAKLICSKPKFTTIPTSADGLAAGDVWSNGGVLTIVS